MKRMILALATVLMTLAVTAQTRVVAHRGYWQTDGSAQNSLTSLRLASEAGCWGTEFDVWITADGVCVVNHDATIDGIRIEDAKYADICDKKLKNGETLPSLEQYLWEAVHYPNLRLVLEIKAHSTAEGDQRCTDEVLRLVKKCLVVEQTDYISFSMRVCERLIEKGMTVLSGPNGLRSGAVDNPVMHVAYLSGDVAPADIKAKGLTGIDYEQSVLLDKHPEWIQEAHDLGLTVNIWTVDDLNRVWDCIGKKIDFVTTNRPVESVKLAK